MSWEKSGVRYSSATPQPYLEWRKGAGNFKSISMFFTRKLMSILNLAPYRKSIVGQY
jgi:hypothetical protein